MAIFSKISTLSAKTGPRPGHSRSQLRSNSRTAESMRLSPWSCQLSLAHQPQNNPHTHTLTLQIPAPVAVSRSICIPNNHNAFDGRDESGPVIMYSTWTRGLDRRPTHVMEECNDRIDDVLHACLRRWWYRWRRRRRCDEDILHQSHKG